MSTVYLMIFFVFVHYFFIELKDYGLKYFIYIILTGTILEMFIVGFDNIYKILSLYVINFGIIMLIVSIDSEINNRKLLSSWSIFNSGVGFFSLFIALSYSFMFVGKYSKFDLTCGILYDNTNKFIDVVSKPLKLSFDEANTVKKTVMSFYNTRVSEIVGYTGVVQSGSLNMLVLSGDLLTGNSLVTGSNQNLSGNVLTGGLSLTGSLSLSGMKANVTGSNLTGTISSESSQKTINKPSGKGILGKIELLRFNILEIFNDKKNVDTGICSYMIEQIGEKYNKGTFKFSVIVLLFFLLWPFLRIIFFLLSIINVIVFKILNLFKVYKFRLVREDVEELL